MRDIKFRAWDDTFKKMYFGGFFLDEDGDLSFSPAVFQRPDYDPLNIILNQSTGLTDKSGNIIYEKDILKLKEDVYLVDWDKRFASFVIHRQGWVFKHFFGEACNPEDCEIIGNIYQHHELLKQ